MYDNNNHVTSSFTDSHPSVPPSDIIETYDFSSREIEVLKLIADGLTNDQISVKLFISQRTIEGHRNSLI